MEPMEVAIEEQKLLTQIIQHQETFALRIVGYAGAVITALSALRLTSETVLPLGAYIVTSGIAIGLFFWTAVIFRVAQDRAIGRSFDVEAHIRDLLDEGKVFASYDGPLIAESLSNRNTADAQRHAAENVRVWGPFALLAAGVALVAILSVAWDTDTGIDPDATESSMVEEAPDLKE